jgi:hypothetical protein
MSAGGRAVNLPLTRLRPRTNPSKRVQGPQIGSFQMETASNPTTSSSHVQRIKFTAYDVYDSLQAAIIDIESADDLLNAIESADVPEEVWQAVRDAKIAVNAAFNEVDAWTQDIEVN